MRRIPGPIVENAAPMPGGNSRHWIRHPGKEVHPRYTLLPCGVQPAKLQLKAGENLQDTVGQAVEAEGADGACAILDGLSFSTMPYVMPDGPVDDEHAAWYSETHIATNAKLEKGTASVGKRDGSWFLHSHAMWHAEETGLGHLLNEQCIIAEDCTIDTWLLRGARLEVAHDSETNFFLFGPVGTSPKGQLEETRRGGLLTIRPHEDVRTTIETACSELRFENASIYGIGSLIGAAFSNSSPMSAQMSEIFLLQGCEVRGRKCTNLPMTCVDPWGRSFSGDLLANQGPVCVTFELLIVAQ